MRLERLRTLILLLLCASTVINYIDRQALAILMPELRRDLGLTSASYGNIATLFLVAYTAGQVLMGVLVDRIGTRLGFVISILIWSAAAVAHAFTSSAFGLGLVRVALGIGESGNWPAGAKGIAEWFPKQRRAFGMAAFDGGSALGAVIAPPLVAWLALRFGWRSAFLATGFLGLLWLAAWLPVYWTPAASPRLSDASKAVVLEEVGPVAEKGSYSASMLQLLRMPKLWGLMATRMFATPVWWFYVFWLPDYLSKGRHFSLAEIGAFAWIPFVTVDAGKLIGGRLSDQMIARGKSATFSRKSVMAAGAVCMAGGLFVVDAPNAGQALAWVSVATFGFGLWSANILALHADLFPSSVIGSAIGWTGMAASLGGVVFTYAIGQTVDRAGYGPVFTFAGLTALVALALLIVAVGKVEQQLPAEVIA